MSATIAFRTLYGVIALVALVLALDWTRRKLRARRDRRAAYIRDEQLRRYNLGAFRGTKDRFLS